MELGSDKDNQEAAVILACTGAGFGALACLALGGWLGVVAGCLVVGVMCAPALAHRHRAWLAEQALRLDRGHGASSATSTAIPGFTRPTLPETSTSKDA